MVSNSGFMVRKKLSKKKLRRRVGRRAWRFEKKLEKGIGGKLGKR